MNSESNLDLNLSVILSCLICCNGVPIERINVREETHLVVEQCFGILIVGEAHISMIPVIACLRLGQRGIIELTSLWKLELEDDTLVLRR